MKVLITGAKGQLGQDCVRILGTKFTVYAFGSHELDISDQQSVQQHFQAVKPDVVVNCAAYTAVDKCESGREKRAVMLSLHQVTSYARDPFLLKIRPGLNGFASDKNRSRDMAGQATLHLAAKGLFLETHIDEGQSVL